MDLDPHIVRKEVHMLERYFTKPQTADRIRGSWLGEAIERYVTWLADRGYQARSLYHRVPLLVRFAAFAHHRGATGVDALAGHVDGFIQRQLRQRVRPCESTAARRKYISDIRHPIQQFLRVIRVNGQPRGGSNATRPFAHWTPHFFAHLQDERGLSPTTVEGYATQLRSFERYVTAQCLDGPQALTPMVLDRFLAEKRIHVSARSLTSTCAALRAWLRYLYREGHVKRDFSAVVEGPRTYRLSAIARSITADEVHRTLSRIDRRSSVGKRDYAMLLLLVVYGLRAREVAALTLEDIDWHTSVLRVRVRKAGHAATYPLAVEVGEGVLDYLQHGRPQSADRHLFLRTVAPHGAVTHSIVADRATAALRRAGIDVVRPGSHTLRHSCAQRLVDAEFSLKVIGDYLGHRRASSTRIYSKVDLEALRDVALGDGEALV
jgi:integrase/recombinase XerD